MFPLHSRAKQKPLFRLFRKSGLLIYLRFDFKAQLQSWSFYVSCSTRLRADDVWSFLVSFCGNVCRPGFALFAEGFFIDRNKTKMTTKIPIPITIQQITPIRFDFCVLITETDVPDEENPLISGRDSPSEETSAEGSALLSSIAEDSAIDSGALGSCSEDSSGSGVGSGVGSGSGSQRVVRRRF